MRRFLALVLLVACQLVGSAAEFKLTNGDVVRGEPADVNPDGMVVRKDVGGFSERIGWSQLTQDSLKELREDPKAKKFVEPFIEIPIEVKKEKAKKEKIVIKDVPRPERPQQKSFFAGLLTPPGFMILGILMFANLYAAFHIAQFRGRPVALVVGVSLIFPILGPIIFLAMPSTDAAAAPVVENAPANTDVVSAETKVAGMQSNLGLAAHQKPAEKGGAGAAQVYKRTDTTFDRRFFETKFAGFFRVVPESPDMVLVIKTAKQEYVARRISRISGSEVHVQMRTGNTELGVPFGEISEVQLRHKDAK